MTKIEGAVVNAVGQLAGAVSSRSLTGLVASGGMIVNDWQITMEDVEGGHRLTAKRGTEVQTMFIRDGSGEAGDGGYYIPDVSDSGELTWTPSREGMPAVEPSSVVGPPGEPGKDGKDGAPGPQGERGEPGADGYTPIKGVDYFDGEPGPAGPQGEKGEKGEPGKDGAPGEDGAQGLQGPQGEPGKDGKDGVDGAPGKDGYTPMKGVDYFDGKDGEPGAAGPQGEPGKDGMPGRDGFSPAVSVAGIDGGHRVTITDAEGAKSFDVLDGAVDRAQIVADVLAALPVYNGEVTDA